jgi:serine/threonine protein kinase
VIHGGEQHGLGKMGAGQSQELAMSIIVQCPNEECQQTVSVDESLSGKGVRCRRCGTSFTIMDGGTTVSGESGRNRRRAEEGSFSTLPTDFGRYRVLQLLGKGGMGAVYLAEDQQLHRKVALKLPTFNVRSEPRRAERFTREAQSAACLHHRNICPVFDSGEVDGRPYIALAFLEGRLLDDVIRSETPLSQIWSVRLVIQIARAMQYAHEQSIIHRDLKPSNIILTTDGEPIVMDFGLARILRDYDSGEEKLTKDGAVIGTPKYMAPEQLNGEQQNISAATDVYSLGVILFELLTGVCPYSGSLLKLLKQIATVSVPSPTDIRPDIDPELATLCQRAMAKDIATRFPDMQEFAEELEVVAQRLEAFGGQLIESRHELVASESDGDADLANMEVPLESTMTADVKIRLESTRDPLRARLVRLCSSKKAVATISISCLLLIGALTLYFGLPSGSGTVFVTYASAPVGKSSNPAALIDVSESDTVVALNPEIEQQTSNASLLPQSQNADVSEPSADPKTKPSLKTVVFVRTKVIRSDLEQLDGATIGHLNFWETPLAREDLAALPHMPNVTFLNLGSTGLKLSDLTRMERFPAVQELHLEFLDVDTNDFSALQEIKELRKLSLWQSNLTDAGLAKLWWFPKLADLNVGRSKISAGITDAGFSHCYNKWLSMTDLDLECAGITDATVPYLAKMHSLKMLNIKNTMISAQGIDSLKRALPACTIEADTNLQTTTQDSLKAIKADPESGSNTSSQKAGLSPLQKLKTEMVAEALNLGPPGRKESVWISPDGLTLMWTNISSSGDGTLCYSTRDDSEGEFKEFICKPFFGRCVCADNSLSEIIFCRESLTTTSRLCISSFDKSTGDFGSAKRLSWTGGRTNDRFYPSQLSDDRLTLSGHMVSELGSYRLAILKRETVQHKWVLQTEDCFPSAEDSNGASMMSPWVADGGDFLLANDWFGKVCVFRYDKTSSSFVDLRVIKVSINELQKYSPRYCAATKELYFCDSSLIYRVQRFNPASLYANPESK